MSHDSEIDVPVQAAGMIATAHRLSAAIPRGMVRIDLYDAPDAIYFGEITPYSSRALHRRCVRRALPVDRPRSDAPGVRSCMVSVALRLPHRACRVRNDVVLDAESVVRRAFYLDHRDALNIYPTWDLSRDAVLLRVRRPL